MDLSNASNRVNAARGGGASFRYCRLVHHRRFPGLRAVQATRQIDAVASCLGVPLDAEGYPAAVGETTNALPTISISESPGIHSTAMQARDGALPGLK